MELFYKRKLEQISHIQAQMSTYAEALAVFETKTLPKLKHTLASLKIDFTGANSDLYVSGKHYNFCAMVSVKGAKLKDRRFRVDLFKHINDAQIKLQMPAPFIDITGAENEMIIAIRIDTNLEVKIF